MILVATIFLKDYALLIITKFFYIARLSILHLYIRMYDFVFKNLKDLFSILIEVKTSWE